MFLAQPSLKIQGVDMSKQVQTIVRQALVAALYVALTFAAYSFSYGAIQFRISEILILLCFYRPDYGIGLILGCLLANLFSPMVYIDIFVGTLATSLSVWMISRSRNLLVASFYPVIFNGVFVGLELYWALGEPLVPSMLYVALGEFCVVSILGVLLFRILGRNKNFLELIAANQNIDR